MYHIHTSLSWAGNIIVWSEGGVVGLDKGQDEPPTLCEDVWVKSPTNPLPSFDPDHVHPNL